MNTIDIDAALDQILDNNDDETEAPSPATAQNEPYLAALPIDALFADYAYQRDLDVYRVAKIANTFKVSLLGIIEVSQRRDGRYAVLDGNHRVQAVKDNAFDAVKTPHLVCRIHTGLTLVDEARIYDELNNSRRGLNGFDRWKARRAAGDVAVKRIEECLANHGLTVSNQVGANNFRSTKNAETIVNLGGIELLDATVALSRAAWPGDQRGLDGTLLAGLAHVLDNYSPGTEYDHDRLVAALAGVLPAQLAARASAAREVHKGTADRLAAHVIVEAYNATKGGSRMVPFLTRVATGSKTKTTAAKTAEEKRSVVRAWAVSKGLMQAGASGRIRKDVREAFAAAHGIDPTTLLNQLTAH